MCHLSLLGDVISFPDRLGTSLAIEPHLRCDTPTASKQADARLAQQISYLFTSLRKWFLCREANSISSESLLLAGTRRSEEKMAKTLKCKCCSSYTWPAYIWATLSILAAFMCPFGLYFSNWLVARQEDGTYNSVSSFRVCLNETSRISFSCDSYLMFDGIYSTYWQAVTLLMGIGTCFIVLVALTSIFGFFVRKLFNPVVVAITGSFQALGGE